MSRVAILSTPDINPNSSKLCGQIRRPKRPIEITAKWRQRARERAKLCIERCWKSRAVLTCVPKYIKIFLSNSVPILQSTQSSRFEHIAFRLVTQFAGALVFLVSVKSSASLRAKKLRHTLDSSPVSLELKSLLVLETACTCIARAFCVNNSLLEIAPLCLFDRREP